VRLPRGKRLPSKKTDTRWEKFAKLKGIHKRKRSKLEFDENSQEYKRRWGYKRANDPTKSDDWIIEAKANDKPGTDPWSELKKERDERVAKNEKQRKKNLIGAKGVRVPGTIDLTSALPVKKDKEF